MKSRAEQLDEISKDILIATDRIGMKEHIVCVRAAA